MLEAERFGMECLARTDVEALSDELFVGSALYAAQDYVAAVAGVVEQGVAYVFHMCPYLMCTACFETAFNK